MGRASLKLGISDSVVEVSLQGTIRIKEAKLPRLMGKRASRCLREEIHLCEKSSRIEAFKRMECFDFRVSDRRPDGFGQISGNLAERTTGFCPAITLGSGTALAAGNAQTCTTKKVSGGEALRFSFAF